MKKKIVKMLLAYLAFTVLISAKPVPVQDDLKSSIERGSKVYANTCLACHQVNGSGVPGMNPPLKKSTWVTGDKKTLINIILKGLDQEIVVNDETYNNSMPAFSTLTDEEIADVLTYIRNSFGNKASQVKESEVKKLRAK